MRKRHKKKAVRKLWKALRKEPTLDLSKKEAIWIDRMAIGWKNRLKEKI